MGEGGIQVFLLFVAIPKCMREVCIFCSGSKHTKNTSYVDNSIALKYNARPNENVFLFF